MWLAAYVCLCQADVLYIETKVRTYSTKTHSVQGENAPFDGRYQCGGQLAHPHNVEGPHWQKEGGGGGGKYIFIQKQITTAIIFLSCKAAESFSDNQIFPIEGISCYLLFVK